MKELTVVVVAVLAAKTSISTLFDILYNQHSSETEQVR